MEHGTTNHEHHGSQTSRLKRFGFAVLGCTLGIDGARGLAFGALVTPFNPVFGIFAAGIGAAESYGAYRALAHAHNLSRTHEQEETHEARLTRVRRYLGGAALAVAGGLLSAGATFATPVAAVSLGLVGFGVSAYGAYKMLNSFEVVPKAEATPTISEQISDIYHNFVGNTRNPAFAR